MAGIDEGSHTATHTFIHKWNEPYLPLTPSCRASLDFGWYSFSIPLRVGGWVGLGGLVKYCSGLPTLRRSPVPLFVEQFWLLVSTQQKLLERWGCYVNVNTTISWYVTAVLMKVWRYNTVFSQRWWVVVEQACQPACSWCWLYVVVKSQTWYHVLVAASHGGCKYL